MYSADHECTKYTPLRSLRLGVYANIYVYVYIILSSMTYLLQLGVKGIA